MNNDLEYYRKPKGWVEFWIGLVVLIFSAIFFGNIAYQEHQVKMMDKNIKMSNVYFAIISKFIMDKQDIRQFSQDEFDGLRIHQVSLAGRIRRATNSSCEI